MKKLLESKTNLCQRCLLNEAITGHFCPRCETELALRTLKFIAVATDITVKLDASKFKAALLQHVGTN